MPDRLEALEAQVATLNLDIEVLRSRLESLEAAGASARIAAAPGRVTTAERGSPSSPAPEPATYGAFAQAVAPLAGRMLLVLAGAFVLRALTDAGTLPASVGVALGFAYAGGVLALAFRADRPAAAGFHGLTSVLVAFPLLLEATTRFKLLGPRLSALLLAALGAAVLGVAVRRRLPGVAWIGTAAVLVTGAVLIVTTGRLVPTALTLVAVGLLTLWIGYLVDWHGLRWPVAAAADLVVLIVLGRAAAPGAIEGPGPALATAAVLVVGYLGSFVARTLYLGRSVVAFEVAQTGGLLVAGLGGTAYLASRSAWGTTPLGEATLALAAVAYAVAFVFVERRQKGSANFPFYASVALVFVLAGTWLALPDAGRGPALAALALAGAALARVQARRTLVLHAAIYALVAAVAGGLLSHAQTTILSPAAQTWPSPSWAALAVMACLGAAAFLAAHASARTTWVERAPQLVLVATVALSAAGLLAGWVAGLLGPPSATADLGVIGTGRTAVLAAAAILAAWIGRREAGREAGWLAWPLVVLLGLKLLLEDFQRGRPATLILSLAFAGAALILVPRLRARATAAAPSAAGPAAG